MTKRSTGAFERMMMGFVMLALCSGLAIGFVLGRVHAKLAEPRIEASMPYFPDCSGTDRAARRNITWNALNGDPGPARNSDDLIAILTAQSLFTALDPLATPQWRRMGAQLYLDKAAKLLPLDAAGDLDDAIASGDRTGIADGLMTLNQLDREAAAFMACILHDRERMSAFLRDEPIPLEPVK